MTRIAFSKDWGGFGLAEAGHNRAIAYLRRRDRLVKRLFAALHISMGMPDRGEELRMIRWADTAAAMRNVFVYNTRADAHAKLMQGMQRLHCYHEPTIVWPWQLGYVQGKIHSIL